MLNDFAARRAVFNGNVSEGPVVNGGLTDAERQARAIWNKIAHWFPPTGVVLNAQGVLRELCAGKRSFEAMLDTFEVLKVLAGPGYRAHFKKEHNTGGCTLSISGVHTFDVEHDNSENADQALRTKHTIDQDRLFRSVDRDYTPVDDSLWIDVSRDGQVDDSLWADSPRNTPVNDSLWASDSSVLSKALSVLGEASARAELSAEVHAIAEVTEAGCLGEDADFIKLSASCFAYSGYLHLRFYDKDVYNKGFMYSSPYNSIFYTTRDLEVIKCNEFNDYTLPLIKSLSPSFENLQSPQEFLGKLRGFTDGKKTLYQVKYATSESADNYEWRMLKDDEFLPNGKSLIDGNIYNINSFDVIMDGMYRNGQYINLPITAMVARDKFKFSIDEFYVPSVGYNIYKEKEVTFYQDKKIHSNIDLHDLGKFDTTLFNFSSIFDFCSNVGAITNGILAVYRVDEPLETSSETHSFWRSVRIGSPLPPYEGRLVVVDSLILSDEMRKFQA